MFYLKNLLILLCHKSFTLDKNGNGRWDKASGGDRYIESFGNAGDIPVAGDWNNDGDDDLGIYEPKRKLYVLDFNNNFKIDGGQKDYIVQAHNGGDYPIAGNWRPKN